MEDKRQESKSRNSYWSLTLFNNEWKDFQHPTWKLEGQEEIAPETGKLHYQGMLHTGQVRFSAVKAVFPQAHIEACRDKEALQRYVHKQRTRASKATTKSLSTNDERFRAVLECMYDMNANHDPSYMDTLMGMKADPNLAMFDECIKQLIVDGQDMSFGMWGMRPDIRKTWVAYRYAFWSVYWVDLQSEEISMPTINADDDEGTGEGDAQNEQTIPIERLDDEDEEQEDSSEGETDTCSEGSSDEVSELEDGN